ncbi:MAG: glycosyltransferase [Muribaculaceae bacterium]|nr:glycosyltransferase [Muribaculaceae bacterium]
MAQDPLKIAIINKSDRTGGAAIVSFRLMEALRGKGHDARMLVTEKLTDSPFVSLAAPRWRILYSFLIERLQIFFANGFNRKTLFKVDTASFGLPLHKHPLVREADAVLINWINQGMLSLKGLRRLLRLGKPVIITMHDMWWMTGICHHAGKCENYLGKCGDCPLLGKLKSRHDLSTKIWKRKKSLLDWEILRVNGNLGIVAVSSWLKEKSLASGLLKNNPVDVIHNPFEITLPTDEETILDSSHSKITILFGAARLDDPIKGLDTLRKTTRILADVHPGLASKIELVLFGNVKKASSLHGFGIPTRHIGEVRGEKALRDTYHQGQIVVSASSYETLPGTLVEAQAFGLVPVSFNQGGQADIISHLDTGYLAEYSDNEDINARNLAQGIVWAAGVVEDNYVFEQMKKRMRENVLEKFSYKKIASSYLTLIKQLSSYSPSSL